jgi:hypothetical protein
MAKNGPARLSTMGAPRPVPLHHRAAQAQVIKGHCFQLDETWGSRHRLVRPEYRKDRPKFDEKIPSHE